MNKKLWAISLFAEQEDSKQVGYNIQIRRQTRYLAGSLLAETAEDAEREGMVWLKDNFKEADGWSSHGVTAAIIPEAAIKIAASPIIAIAVQSKSEA